MNCFDLPKVELHAHLNGSLSNEALIELHKHKYGNLDITLSSYTIFEKELHSMSHCFGKFKYAHDLTDTPERLAMATKRVIEEFAAENTIYFELRSTPRGTEIMSKSEYISLICETIIKSSMEHPEIIVKYLPSIDRAQSVQVNEETLDNILKAKREFPNIIVGLDLSGNPAVGSFSALKPILTRARESGLPLSVHCAEIAGKAKETREMLEFEVDRIGHGTFLDETPELWTLFASKGILVECCLSSNFKCGTVANYNEHHFQKLIKVNNPLAICTDDYGVFDTTLTAEFGIAQEYFGLSSNDLERILKDSIDHAFCSKAEKTKLLDQIANYFSKLEERKNGEQ